jgi:Holliday junction DNA helicase RuvA
MIERLTGVCVHKGATSAIIDVNGVGYGVEMTEGALLSLPLDGKQCTVWIYTLVREDALRLFGFLSHEERAMFLMLLDVNKVGPKHALNILGAMSLQAIVRAAEAEDAAAFKAVQGIGEELAKRLALDMKRKTRKMVSQGLLSAAEAPFDLKLSKTLSKTVVDDLRSALENFGYKGKELDPILTRFAKKPPTMDIGELMRLALAELTGAARGSSKGATKETPKTTKAPLEETF